MILGRVREIKGEEGWRREREGGEGGWKREREGGSWRRHGFEG